MLSSCCFKYRAAFPFMVMGFEPVRNVAYWLPQNGFLNTRLSLIFFHGKNKGLCPK